MVRVEPGESMPAVDGGICQTNSIPLPVRN
jgi:hypothetical protein